MTIGLYDPRDSTYYLIDQVNRTSAGRSKSIDDALHDMQANSSLANFYFTLTLDEYTNKFPEYTISCLDQTPQPYEYW